MTSILRTHNVSVRLNDKEYNRLKYLCHVLHEKQGTILRMNLRTNNGSLRNLKSTNKVPNDKWIKNDFNALDTLNDLRIQLARTGNLVNQIAHKANAKSGVQLSDDNINALNTLYTEICSVKSTVTRVADKS